MGPGPDPCLTNNGGCSQDATCQETSGGVRCHCNSGFAGDGISCETTHLELGVSPNAMTFCLYRGGTCVITATGAITCTKKTVPQNNEIIPHFTYPTSTHPNGEKYVAIACQSHKNTLCAITESGKLRCYHEFEHGRPEFFIPSFDDGDIEARSGKFVDIRINNSGQNALTARRDDGKVEFFGMAIARSRDDDRDDPELHLTTNGGRVRKARLDAKISYAEMGRNGIMLYDNGLVDMLINGNSHILMRQFQEWLDQTTLDTKGRVSAVFMSFSQCVLTTNGEMGCTRDFEGHVVTEHTPDEGKWAAGGGSGEDHICAPTTRGKVNCFGGNLRGIPTVWEREGSDWVQCEGGFDHACCSKADGSLVCKGAIDTETTFTVVPPTTSAFATNLDLDMDVGQFIDSKTDTRIFRNICVFLISIFVVFQIGKWVGRKRNDNYTALLEMNELE